MSNLTKYIIFAFVLFAIPATNKAIEVLSVPEQIRLNYITADNGLPQNTVDCILKDSRGFMWFGTWNGLCRFDGYSFKTYRSEEEDVTLPGNFIQSICEDDDNNLWIGTDKGLAFFNYLHFQFNELPLLKNDVGKFSISCLLKGHDGNIYVATIGNGLWKVIQNQEGQYTSQRILQEQLPSQSIQHLCLLNDQYLLIATTGGLAILNPGDGNPKPVWNKLREAMQGINISAVFQDSKGNIWIGTSDTGVYHFETNTLQLKHYTPNPDNEFSLDHLTVYAIIEDLGGNVIIGTLGGLNYYNPQNDTFSHFPESTETRKFLNNPFVNSLYADDQGNIWIGTEKGGVNYYNTYQKPFFAIKHDPTNPNSISHNTINSVFWEENALWVGTAGGGLNKMTQDERKSMTFKVDPSSNSGISNNFITSIFRDKEKQLWVGTWGGGLCRLLDENRNKFEIHTNIPGNASSICSNFVSYIEPLDDKHILIGARGGLDILDLSNRTYIHVHNKMQLEQIPEVGCVLADSKNRIWVGSETGLYRFNSFDLLNLTTSSENIKYDFFINDPQNKHSLPGNFITHIFEADDGTIWFGTYGNGICKYSDINGKDEFIIYNELNGLCNNVAYSIEEDLNGNLWISTDKGLSRFDPQNETFRNYFTSDGLLSDQFYWSASCNDKKGNLYFGGINGLNYFSPAQIETFPITPTPVFTEFSIFNTPVQVGQKFHSNVVLEAPVSECNTIQLSYKDAVFSIEFSALNYFLPNKIKYSYKMEGVDQNWVEVDANRRYANYTNLSGGEYLFRVKASNSDGIWSAQPARLLIVVKPPFWNTAWFQFIAVLFVILMVILYTRFRIRFLKEQKRKLEEQVRERTHKIEEQKAELQVQAENLQHTNQQLEERQILIEGQKVELEKQNRQIAHQRDEVIELNEKVNLVNQLRLRFFTNISHEFRTPLTLIIDPLEQLMEKYRDDRNTSNTISIINRNAQRLVNLINQLIYFRKIETGKLQLNVCCGDMVSYLHNIFLSFADLAEHQQIEFSFNAGEMTDETWFDSEKIENVFYNLLSNAFKFTPVSGKINMQVNFIKNGNNGTLETPYVSISVTDSGSGISAEHIPHIFDRFYKAEQSKKDTDFTSSGIGLALTYEIVQALHGEISVESEPGKGSRFTVRIPYTRERFKPDEVNEAAVPGELNIEGRINVLADHIVARKSGYEKNTIENDDHSKPTILIVEDNFDLRSFLLHSLRQEYRVLGAENGKIGFEMAKKYSPEVIISDVMMPVMDGIELCSHLKKNIQTSHIPVILLTAKNMIENWIEGLESGADDYIPKPFNFHVLQIKIHNLIESRKKIKQLFSSPDDLSPDQVSGNKIDEEFISKVYAILEKNYDQEDFSIDQLAREMFVSRSLLYKKIKALTDLNVTDFINSYKLKKAVTIIRTTKRPISEIAFSVGFNDPKYFSRIFKKFYGSSPSEFTKKEVNN